MPILQLNGQNLQLNGQDLYLNGISDETVPPPIQPKGKGRQKKQQIYSPGPWAYR